MPTIRQYPLIAIVLAVTITGGISMPASAQQDAENTTDESEPMDEIVVVAGKKPGDPVDVDARYEELLKSRLMKEQYQLRVMEEEHEWRTSGLTDVQSPSRIRWGYDPRDELEIRRSSELVDMPWLTTRPATLFRVDF